MTVEQYVKLWRLIWQRWDLHGNYSVSTDERARGVYRLNPWLADLPITTATAERVMADLEAAGTTPTPDLLHRAVRRHCRRPGRQVLELDGDRIVEVDAVDVDPDTARQATRRGMAALRDRYPWLRQSETAS